MQYTFLSHCRCPFGANAMQIAPFWQNSKMHILILQGSTQSRFKYLIGICIVLYIYNTGRA
jgi:hypothetical protein